MSKCSRISASQLTVLLLASRLSQCLLLTPQSTAGLCLSDRLLATALSALLLFLLFCPTLWILHRRGLVDTAYRYSRCAGRMLCIWYLILCLFVICIDIIQFYDFAEKVMTGTFSVVWLTVALVAVAFAASLYGIQALGRAALPVFTFAAVCLAVFGLALLPELKALHFPPLANRSFATIMKAAVAELPRSAELVLIGWLYPYVNGSCVRAVGAFCGLTSLFSAAVITTALGVLGDFAAVTAYPYYAAVSVAQIGVFQRLDMLITAVWLSTFFIRLSLFCTAFVTMANRVFGRRARRWSAVLGTGALWGFTLLIRHNRNWDAVTVAYWCVLGFTCVGLPLLLVWLKRRRVL